MNKKMMLGLAAGAVLCVFATSAMAHISVSSGPAPANANAEVTFSVGHGCEDTGGAMSDTIKVVIDMPAGSSNVRAMPNAFGKATVATNGGLTTVTFEKKAGDELPDDTGYYKFSIRFRTPNAPFTKIHLPTHQFCVGGTTAEWTTLPDGDGGAGNVPTLPLLPARQPGWNRWTVPVDVQDMSLFADALIVWKGNNQAYSKNANTLAQITAEPGVTELKELKANDEIWVKY